MSGLARFLAHVNFELAKAVGEIDWLCGRELLVAEYHDLMIEKSTFDLGESSVAQGWRQIDPGNFRAQCLPNVVIVIMRHLRLQKVEW